MPLGSDDDFTKEELALIPAPEDDDEQQAVGEEKGVQPTPEPAPASEQPPVVAAPVAPSPAPTPTPVVTAAPAPEPQGDVRAALRAARRGEHRERERANKLEAELTELRSRAPAAPNPDEITDADIADVERDFPAAAKVARFARSQQRAAAAAPAPAPIASQEFVPPSLPLQVQEAVDSVPDLLAWQNAQDQTLFAAAIEADRYFSSLPAWKDKPMAERFAAVVNRVKQDAGISSPPAPAPRIDPAAAIASAPRTTPSTLSDIGGGGGGTQPEASDLARFSKMSEEQIMADLARG